MTIEYDGKGGWHVMDGERLVSSHKTEAAAKSRGNPDWAQQRVAKALSAALETRVDPCCVHLFPARGYWSHNHQDCQRWTGHAEVEGFTYTLGSWGMTVSAIKMGEQFEAHDHRGERRAYSDFSFERPERVAELADLIHLARTSRS